jgi:hypothetical protein
MTRSADPHRSLHALGRHLAAAFIHTESVE